jgi:hypothetical protein
MNVELMKQLFRNAQKSNYNSYLNISFKMTSFLTYSSLKKHNQLMPINRNPNICLPKSYIGNGLIKYDTNEIKKISNNNFMKLLLKISRQLKFKKPSIITSEYIG